MKTVNVERIKYCVADFLTVAAGWFVFNIIRYFTLPVVHNTTTLDVFLRDPVVLAGQFIVPLAMLILYAVSGAYNPSNTLYKSRLDELVNAFVVSFIGMLGIYFTALFNDNIPERLTGYELMLVLLLCLWLPTAVARMTVISLNSRRIKQGEFSVPTLVIGMSGRTGAKLRNIMDSEAHAGLKIMGCVDVDERSRATAIQGLPVYDANLDSLTRVCREHGAEAVIVMPSPHGLTRTAQILEKLYNLEIPIYVTPELRGLLSMRPRITQVASEPLVDVTKAGVGASALNLKRLGDVAVSAAALVVLAPVFAAIALLVRIDSSGPVFYRQTRLGLRKRPFKILKFRTMYVNAEAHGPALASDDDPRVTRTGRFLRKYRLDELPQFWNVLRGEMSLVGPRPERPFYTRQIVRRYPAYTLVHQVRPGITSWGMVKYGYAATVDQMIERLPYDLLYIENISLGLDLKILFHTVQTVLRGRGQ